MNLLLKTLEGKRCSIPTRYVLPKARLRSAYKERNQSTCDEKFNIVPMVTVVFTDKMGSRPIVPVKVPITIGSMMDFDGTLDDGDGNVTCT